MSYATRIPGWVLLILLISAVSTAVATTPRAPAVSATGTISVATTTPASGEAGAAVGEDAARTAVSGGLHRGWPLDLNGPGAGFPYTPTLFDADNDGADEIFMTGGETFGLRGDGTFLPGWPTSDHAYMGYGTNDQKPGPSVADIDGDGDFEILWSLRDWSAGSAHMWCFNARNFDGTNLPNFPQFAPDDDSNALDVPFVLGDTDGDTDLEAWGPHSLGNAFIHYRVSAFDQLGTRLFTHDMNSGENALSLYYGDLDGNGSVEMFTVTWMSPSLYLHAFTSTGDEQPGYPILLYTMTSGSLPFGPPVITDLDRDGDLEILFGQWASSAARVRAFHHDATPVAGWPIQVATGFQMFYVALGDLTGDGVPELIVTGKVLSSDYRVHVFDIATATSLPGWPYALPYWPEGFPSVADVSNDGYQDICISTGGGDVRAIGHDGVLLPGYPKTMSAPSISGAAVGDIDGDGLFELVAATWDGFVYAWDTEGAAWHGRAEWPMRGVDARNTGIFVPWVPDPAHVTGAGTTPRLTLQVEPNPVVARATLRLGDAADGIVFGIFDTGGRQIDALRSQGGTTLTWTPPRGTVPGIYFVRPQGAAASEATRFVLVR